MTRLKTSPNGTSKATDAQTQQPSIFSLLPQIMQDVGTIEKKQHGEAAYRFRSIDDAMNAISPVLVTHGVSTSFRCFDHQLHFQRDRDRFGNQHTKCRATLSLELTFWGPDGSHISSTAAGEGVDHDGDKATCKAMSTAMKYALFFGLMVPPGKKEQT